jgi:DNA-binding NarL/FixJ family response regulator
MGWSDSLTLPAVPLSTKDRIRIVLLDPHALLRTSLSRVFAAEPDFELVGECARSGDALELLHGAAPDIVLLESDLGEEHGNDFISAALHSGYKGRFMVLASSPDARDFAPALKLGASGIFLKSESAARLVHAVRTVAGGEIWIDPRVLQVLAERCPLDETEADCEFPVLSDREQKVLEGIVEGLSNRRIGDGIGLSEGSVKAVVQQLFEKTGVRTRSQLVRIALERSANLSINRTVHA